MASRVGNKKRKRVEDFYHLADKQTLVSPKEFVNKVSRKHWRKVFKSREHQLRKANERRAAAKRNLKNVKLSAEQKKALAYAKKYKSAVAKRYSSKLTRTLKQRGYFPIEIAHAKNYSTIGKIVEQQKLDNVQVTRWSKDLRKAKVNGKWISQKALDRKIVAAIKKGRIKGYMEVCGLTKKQAEKVYKILNKKGKNPLADKWRALLY